MPIFSQTLETTKDMTGQRAMPCIVVTNTRDAMCVNVGDDEMQLHELLQEWKHRNTPCMLQIEYDYLYSDVDVYPGYRGTTHFDNKDHKEGWYHVTTAVYNHDKCLLTYVDSIGKHFADDDDMPVEVAKDVHVARRIEAYLKAESAKCSIAFEGSREMYGWDGLEYTRTPPQQLESEDVGTQRESNDKDKEPVMRRIKALSAWGATYEGGVVDSGTCFLWSLLIANDLIENNVTGKEWSIAFTAKCSTPEESQLYLSHRLMAVLVSCKRTLLRKSEKLGQIENSTANLVEALEYDLNESSPGDVDSESEENTPPLQLKTPTQMCEPEYLVDELLPHLETSNIESVTVHELDGKNFIMIGESHGTQELREENKKTFASFLQRLDAECNCNIDVFVENNWTNRGESKNKQHWTTPDAMMEMGGDSLDTTRVAVQECDKIRLHNVDVRDEGFLQFAYSPYSEDDNLIRMYGMSLNTNAQLMQTIARKSVRKINEKYKPVVTQQIDDVAQHARSLINTSEFSPIWNAYSMLNDPYTLARMLRRDNSDLCIFYGGDNHAQRLNSMFTLLGGHS